MATAAKKTAGSKSTAVAKWDEALAARAKIAKKAEASVSTGEWISVKGGQLAYQGNVVPGNKMDVVILAYRLENQFYDGPYDPNTPQAPSCYAFGVDEESMAPHEKAEGKQAESCHGCPMNEWGSAEQGRGKACKNVRRVCIIPADALDNGADGIAEAQWAFLKVPVMSVKGWAGYVNQLAQLNRPPLAFVTEISVTPDAQSQFKVNFNAKESIEDGELIGALLEKADKAEGAIEFPYQPVEQTVAMPKNGRGSKVQAGRAPAKTAAPKMPPARKAAAKTAGKTTAKKF
jgi:hypothetical protein